jgi:hypothetical protein
MTTTLLRPKELEQLAMEAELHDMEKEEALKAKKKQAEHDLREAFMKRKVAPEAVERINQAVSVAAQRGEHQIQAITFPCSFCTDGGRRINIADPEWPMSLQGFAKNAYDFFEKELRPLGYKLHAEIISYPGGMPGEAALFLKW